MQATATSVAAAGDVTGWRARLRVLPLIVLGLVAGVGCSESAPPRFEVAYRLVEPALRRGALVEPASLLTRDTSTFAAQTSEAAGLPRATIDDESRHVLTAPDHGSLAYNVPMPLSKRGKGAVALPVEGSLRSASRVVVLPRVRAEGQRSWLRSPPRLVALDAEKEKVIAAFEVEVPSPRRRGPAALSATALRVEGPTTSYTTQPIPFPAGARLELGLGVLEAAADQGPVRFDIETCASDRCDGLFSEVLDPATPEGAVWNDRVIDLAPLGGKTRALRFRTEHLAGGEFSFPVWADPVVLAPAGRREKRPNIVLLSIDTLRRDHLDLYGYFRETAPFLRTQMAARGVVFDGLVAEATTTDPSHMTMFTSLPALVHGVAGFFRGLAVPATTLAERLRAHGYQTAAFTEDGPLAGERGFAIGFDSYRENKSDDLLVPVGRVEDTFGQARRWLVQRADRPFFLFLHTFQVHAPYRPPEPYRALFDESEPASLTPSQRRTIANYDREIRYVDDEVGKLVRWMEQRGIGDHNTIWIVLSDHGEEFWEHGSLGHLALPHEELLRVPLIVRGPGIARGARRSEAVHHLDLMPTVLELAGVPAPGDVQGQSFATRLRRGIFTASAPAPRTLFSAAWALPRGYAPPAFAVRADAEKLMTWQEGESAVEAWFDLAADPRERNPRKAGPPELRSALDGYRLRATALAAELGERAGAAARSTASEPVPLDPEREEMLRALGYLE